MGQKDFYLGLDIGTDSVGYAVTDEQYNLLKFSGDAAWGVHLFDEAELSQERRAFRVARRRLDRRKQRVMLLQELFAPAIRAVDADFYKRLQASDLFRDEAGDRFPIFNDVDYTDRDYYKAYPTIHHLICDLMADETAHDVRLVYLACAWLVSNRGHFLSNLDKENISALKNFDKVYSEFEHFFTDNGYAYPWAEADRRTIGEILKKKTTVTAKNKELTLAFTGGGMAPKEASEDFPFGQRAIIKLLAGGTAQLKELFDQEAYAEFGAVSLNFDDDKLEEIAGNLGDDFALITALRQVFDWSVLVEAIGDAASISEAKVETYRQHKADLAILKRIIKNYRPEKYDEVFREIGKANYAAYAYHSNKKADAKFKKVDREAFSKFITGIVKDITPKAEDEEILADMRNRLDLRTFLPKQKNTDNRVIPHQLYQYELHEILKNAEGYLPFLTEKDESGLSVSDKIRSIFAFKIPYFVGPLNEKSDHAWIVRKAGKIYPWNFEDIVDLDASEEGFIRRMTNQCTYLPGEPVLPKDSLLYHKFTVLNEINNLSIHGERISVELKQQIYSDLFLNKKKVTRKRLREYLIVNGVVEKDDTDAITGIDEEIKSNLLPQISFRRLLDEGTLSEEDVEKIIERSTFSDDKTRLKKWLAREYPQLNSKDVDYIRSLRLRDFGRLSQAFLEGIIAADRSTGEAFTIISALWNTQKNLMELLSDQFTFAETIERFREDYYREHPVSLSERMDEMYLSNSVKRSVFRTLDIVKDVKKAFGAPKKIFVEVTRGGSPDQKGKRTKSRSQQLRELYDKCRDEDLPLLKQQLEAMGDAADSKLQSEKLFLYYLQLGKSAYSDKRIPLEALASKAYDIDHIYPQAFVKDDSIINNKVLVLSEENGAKSNNYPIQGSIRHHMQGFWSYLQEVGLMSKEKYKRLTRSTPFTEEERYGFINRQLTSTSQSTKAVATLLKEHLPETEIVYCKARLVTDFRQAFDLFKSRQYNDLHHAVDAYLNIVTGNVYNMRFTKNFNVHSQYSIKTETVFTRPVTYKSQTIWDGIDMLAKVKSIANKNTAHITKYAFMKKGGFFDQLPVRAADGLIPRKKHLPTQKYGGYNKPGVMFFIPVKYQLGKKSELFILPVELLCGKRFLADPEFAQAYAVKRLERILKKPVDQISFPLGMRPWKVNTVLALDGFKYCITGSSNGGTRLILQPMMSFSSAPYWAFYLKKLEVFVEKNANNPQHVYDEAYDKVNCEDNLKLYDLYCQKLTSTIYSKRINSPLDILLQGREKFSGLDIKQQAQALLNIHQVFGRIAGGCDLTLVGGKKGSAATSASSAISNLGKRYQDVRVWDTSPSGLWSKRSPNLLDLL